jgi:hypothetical protein
VDESLARLFFAIDVPVDAGLNHMHVDDATLAALGDDVAEKRSWVTVKGIQESAIRRESNADLVCANLLHAAHAVTHVGQTFGHPEPIWHTAHALDGCSIWLKN